MVLRPPLIEEHPGALNVPRQVVSVLGN